MRSSFVVSSAESLVFLEFPVDRRCGTVDCVLSTAWGRKATSDSSSNLYPVLDMLVLAYSGFGELRLMRLLDVEVLSLT